MSDCVQKGQTLTVHLGDGLFFFSTQKEKLGCMSLLLENGADTCL